MSSTPPRSDERVFTATVIRNYPDSATEARWRTFLSSSRWASHFVSPEYFLDPKTKSRRPFAILVGDATEIVGCLTGWHEQSRTVSGLSTHPQLLLADGPQRHGVEKTLALSLLEEARQDSFVDVRSWHELTAFQELRFWSRKSNATYVIDLATDEDGLFRRLAGKRRTGIRNALKKGLEVKEATVEDVLHFYEVLKVTHVRLGLGPPLPMDDLLAPESNRKLFVAMYEGRCIAGTIIRFSRSGLAEYSENASLSDFWQVNPNELLLWTAIKWANSAGCTGFNLGGYNLFKKEFGGTLYPMIRLSKDQSFLSLRHKREKLDSLARQMFRSVRNGIRARLRRK